MTEQKCPRCGGPVTKELDDYFDCPACQLLFTISPEGRFTASMPIRPDAPIQDGLQHWSFEPWFAKFEKEVLEPMRNKK